MGLRGYEDIPGWARIYAWPFDHKVSSTSFIIRFSRQLSVHFADFGFDRLLSQDNTLDYSVTRTHTEIVMEPDYLIYPGRRSSGPLVIRRSLGNGRSNILYLYPVKRADFNFMAGELHCLLRGPSAHRADPDVDPLGPHAPLEYYADLKVFQFIQKHILHALPVPSVPV